MSPDAAATIQALGQPLADPHNYATISGPDLELKRILWALLSDLSRQDPVNLELIVRSDLIETLLMYLSVELSHYANADGALGSPSGGGAGQGSPTTPLSAGDNNNAAGGSFDATDDSCEMMAIPAVITRLPRTQLRVLQQQAMAVLLNLAPRAPERFQSLRGHIITLRFLDVCGAQRDGASLVQGALMLLISVVGLPGLQGELGELDAVRIRCHPHSAHLTVTRRCSEAIF